MPPPKSNAPKQARASLPAKGEPNPSPDGSPLRARPLAQEGGRDDDGGEEEGWSCGGREGGAVWIGVGTRRRGKAARDFLAKLVHSAARLNRTARPGPRVGRASRPSRAVWFGKYSTKYFEYKSSRRDVCRFETISHASGLLIEKVKFNP